MRILNKQKKNRRCEEIKENLNMNNNNNLNLQTNNCIRKLRKTRISCFLL